MPQAAQASSASESLDFARQAVAQVTPRITTDTSTNDRGTPAVVPDGFLSKPLVTETKVTPPVVRRTVTTFDSTAVVGKPQKVNVKLAANSGNHFIYGYCTWYVASRRNVPWFGNAGTWLSGAQGAGFATGSDPRVGAIIVTAESGYGHVGIVESVNGDGTITISEMNYSGFARVNTRTLSIAYGAIKGYIY